MIINYIKILEVLKEEILSKDEFINLQNYEFNNVTSDSRQINDKSIFFAIKGAENDGHKYIEEISNNGVKLIIYENDTFKKNNKSNYIQVKSTRRAFSLILNEFYGNSSQKLKIIGITGTNGKTTTSSIIYQLLKKMNKKVALIGTLGYFYGDKHINLNNTTPGADFLHKEIKNLVDNNFEYLVMEVSSHSIEMHRVTGIEFDIVIFTNLTPEHLDYHLTMENYFSAKSKIFMKNFNNYKKCKGIINIDDDYGIKLSQISDIDIFTFGKSKADYIICNTNYNINQTEFSLIRNNISNEIVTNLLGEHNVYNLTASLIAMDLLGFSINNIMQFTKNLDQVPGRMDIMDFDNYKIIIDYAHTPDALERLLNSVKKISSGKKIITIFGCGGDRDKEKRPIMGNIAQKNSDIVIVTSDNPRTEDPNKIIEDIIINIKDCKNIKIIPDRFEAIKEGITIAKENNSILIIAGKGHEDYQIIGKNKIHFDDKEVANKIIRGEI